MSVTPLHAWLQRNSTPRGFTRALPHKGFSGPPRFSTMSLKLEAGRMEEGVNTSKRRGAKKHPGTAKVANCRGLGRLASKGSLNSYSAEEQALMDHGLRILARMLARAHLQRHGIHPSGATDSTREVLDNPVEGASTPDLDITGTS